MLLPSKYPSRLHSLPQLPERLFVEGASLSELCERPCLGVVGSRKVSAYGKDVTYRLAREAAEQGVVIISGLAIGVDSIAHRAALDAGGRTIAVLPGPLEKIYPASHHTMARQIIEKGGALVSEYPEGSSVFKHQFIARNRIISGLSNALMVSEAAEKSGSLHTARFALEQGIDVLAVPGNITSPTSTGTNNLLKAGAAAVTSIGDILYALGVQPASSIQLHLLKGSTEQETLLLQLLGKGEKDGDVLLRQSELTTESFNQTMTMLEINGRIRALGANQWALL